VSKKHVISKNHQMNHRKLEGWHGEPFRYQGGVMTADDAFFIL
jgi:hypothetical protein